MKKYTSKKLKNQELVDFITAHIKTKGVLRIKNCGSVLQFIQNRGVDADFKKKLIFAMSCNNRFCPVCAWRKAKKDAMIIAVLMRYIQEKHDKEFIMLTLTVPNVDGDELKDKISEMNYASKKLFLKKDVDKVNQGYIRKLEVTYNSTAKTYHPHFHILIAVNKSYFTSRDYIKQAKWLNMWQEAMNDYDILEVDVRKVTVKDGMNEIAKYAAKDADYLYSQEVFDVFYKSLKGAQVLTYNKLFKDANKLYKDDKLDAYKIVDPTEYLDYVANKWVKERFIDDDGEIHEPNQYIEIDKRELTDKEKLKYNFKAVGEEEDLQDD